MLCQTFSLFKRSGVGRHVAPLTFAGRDIMAWRVTTRPGTATLEVIDPEDWNRFSVERQNSYESVSLFNTEQEADKFATGQVEAAKAVRPKLPRR